MSRNNIIPYLIASAIALEVSAYPKPGNVHRFADFLDMKYEDFIITSHIATKSLIQAFKRGFKHKYGKTVFADLIYYAVKDVIKYVGVNTSLGSLTLLIPLAMNTGYCISMGDLSLECIVRIKHLIDSTTVYDSIYYYRAVRLARPSHLPKLENEKYVDIWAKNYIKQLLSRNQKLIDIFKYSRKIEIVHDELLTNYRRSINALKILKENLSKTHDWNQSIVITYIYLLSREKDSLIIRKYGDKTAEYVRKRAGEIYKYIIRARGKEWVKHAWFFDNELRIKNINPGSIADIVCSTIALYLVDKYLT